MIKHKAIIHNKSYMPPILSDKIDFKQEVLLDIRKIFHKRGQSQQNINC
jgi:hypothetical protein